MTTPTYLVADTNPLLVIQQSGTTLVSSLSTTPGSATLPSIICSGYNSTDDNGGGTFVWNSTDTRTADGGTIIAVTGVATGRWNRVYSGALYVRWFGATGNGITDDTSSVLSALDALMTLPSGGELIFDLGTYLVTKTTTLVGDYYHHYVLRGIAGGFGNDSGTRLLWGGPAGATLINTWGLNCCQFYDLAFDGGAGSILLGRYVSPSVPIIGAGCAMWCHTNQYNGGSFPGISGGAQMGGNSFTRCNWTGVIGGLYPSMAFGDGPQSPGCVVWNGTTYTIYQVSGSTPPSTGDNNVDTATSTTLTADCTIGDTAPALTSATGFTKRRGCIIGSPGQVPWGSTISNISGATLTVYDPSSTVAVPVGSPYLYPHSTAVAYSCYPAATGLSLPSGTVINQNSLISNSSIVDTDFVNCFWYGGGWDTTSANPQQHTYASFACYSGANTENFRFRGGYPTTACYLFYAPYSANNRWHFEDLTPGTFSAAFLKMSVVQNPMVTIRHCDTESNTNFGYYAYVVGSAGARASLTIDNNEMVMATTGNPYGAVVFIGGTTQLRLTGNTMVSVYDIGSAAQPPCIEVNGGGTFAGPSIIAEFNSILGEQYQMSIYNNAGNDLMASGYGGTQSGNPNGNFTHAWDTSQIYQTIGYGYPTYTIRLTGNYGSNASSEMLWLPNVDYNPTQLYTGSLITAVSNGVAGTETYRGQLRDTWCCYEIDYSMLTTSTALILAQYQSKTISESSLFETTATFTGTGGFTSLNVAVGTSAGSYVDIMSSTAVPGASASPPLIYGGLAIPNTAQTNTWGSSNLVLLGIIPYFNGSLTAGHGRLYYKCAVLYSPVEVA